MPITTLLPHGHVDIHRKFSLSHGAFKFIQGVVYSKGEIEVLYGSLLHLVTGYALQSRRYVLCVYLIYDYTVQTFLLCFSCCSISLVLLLLPQDDGWFVLLDCVFPHHELYLRCSKSMLFLWLVCIYVYIYCLLFYNFYLLFYNNNIYNVCCFGPWFFLYSYSWNLYFLH